MTPISYVFQIDEWCIAYDNEITNECIAMSLADEVDADIFGSNMNVIEMIIEGVVFAIPFE